MTTLQRQQHNRIARLSGEDLETLGRELDAIRQQVLDSRGERDVFRATLPILGQEQWQFIGQVFANLASDIDVLAVVTATPVLVTGRYVVPGGMKITS